MHVGTFNFFLARVQKGFGGKSNVFITLKAIAEKVKYSLLKKKDQDLNSY